MFESEINWLREELNKHNYNYYVLNKPTVSDKEYDDMMRRLQDLEAAHKELFDPLSAGHMPVGLYLTQWILVGICTIALPQSVVRGISYKDTRSLHRAMLIGTVVVVARSEGVVEGGTGAMDKQKKS